MRGFAECRVAEAGAKCKKEAPLYGEEEVPILQSKNLFRQLDLHNTR